MSLSNTAYRVKLYASGHYAYVVRIGMNGVEKILNGIYAYQDLPEWMRDRIAVLSILSVPPPANDVDGVGQRISEDTFWLYE